MASAASTPAVSLTCRRMTCGAPVGFLRTLLQNQGYEVKTLGIGQGLSNKVPSDAGLVIIAGRNDEDPSDEVNALVAYLNDGGPTSTDSTRRRPAATTAIWHRCSRWRASVQPRCSPTTRPSQSEPRRLPDKANIVSTSFSSHVSVTTLSRASGRARVILPKCGYFERDGATPPGVQLDFTLRSMPRPTPTRTRTSPATATNQPRPSIWRPWPQTLGDGASAPGKSKRELRPHWSARRMRWPIWRYRTAPTPCWRSTPSGG